jgi:cyclase
MLAKRIIPCLDVKDGRTVKGVNFVSLRDAGDAVELASRYADQGADELVFLDITATVENRKTLISLVNQVSKQINIPFTVGGGIRSITDAKELLYSGAEKISLNSAAVNDPLLIEQLASEFGNQCVVIAIDAKKYVDTWKVFINGGRTETDLEVVSWAKEVARLGAGEILLTSMDQDGTKDGFAIPLTKTVSDAISIPIIASGGAGTMAHFSQVFKEANADAALAASILQFGEISIPELKLYLKNEEIVIRL